MPRPANRQTENKPARVPVSGLRDILSVYGKDPGKEYRFIVDNDENGMRIQTFKRGGWEFTQSGDHSSIQVGQECVYKSERSNGSIVRQPSGTGKDGSVQYNYLMEIKKEWFEEDKAAKNASIDETESAITGKVSSEDNELGQYGEVKISRKRGQ